METKKRRRGPSIRTRLMRELNATEGSVDATIQAARLTILNRLDRERIRATRTHELSARQPAKRNRKREPLPPATPADFAKLESMSFDELKVVSAGDGEIAQRA